jgi:ABC-2 type transport system ATP-binding protein
MVDRVGIINYGRLVAVGTLAELRAHAQRSDASLEDLFLQLTGGADYREVALALSGAAEARR